MTDNQNNQIAKRPIEVIAMELDGMKEKFNAMLPKHLPVERLFRVVITALQQNPKLLEASRPSLYLAIMRAAQLGLEPDGILGQAYLIPYSGQVQFIVGYRGLIDLARRSGEVSNIIAQAVRVGDTFEVDWAQEMPFIHKPKIVGERGVITHFWAMARFKDGGFHWDYLTVDDVIKIRDGSSGWKAATATAKKFGKPLNSPWESNFEEMGKKTAIRRIAKYLPMSVQKAAVIEDLVDRGATFSLNDIGDPVVEHDADGVVQYDGGQPDSLSQFEEANPVATPAPAPAAPAAAPKAKAAPAQAALPITSEGEPPARKRASEGEPKYSVIIPSYGKPAGHDDIRQAGEQILQYLDKFKRENKNLYVSNLISQNGEVISALEVEAADIYQKIIAYQQ